MNTRTKTYVVAMMLSVALIAGIIFCMWAITNHTAMFFGVAGLVMAVGAFTCGFVTVLRTRGWK